MKPFESDVNEMLKRSDGMQSGPLFILGSLSLAPPVVQISMGEVGPRIKLFSTTRFMFFFIPGI